MFTPEATQEATAPASDGATAAAVSSAIVTIPNTVRDEVEIEGDGDDHSSHSSAGSDRVSSSSHVSSSSVPSSASVASSAMTSSAAGSRNYATGASAALGLTSIQPVVEVHLDDDGSLAGPPPPAPERALEHATEQEVVSNPLQVGAGRTGAGWQNRVRSGTGFALDAKSAVPKGCADDDEAAAAPHPTTPSAAAASSSVAADASYNKRPLTSTCCRQALATLLLDALFVCFVAFVQLCIMHFVAHAVAAGMENASRGSAVSGDAPNKYEWWAVSRLRMSFYILSAVLVFVVTLVIGKKNEPNTGNAPDTRSRYPRYIVPFVLLGLTAIAAIIVVNTAPLTQQVPGEPVLVDFDHGECTRTSEVYALTQANQRARICSAHAQNLTFVTFQTPDFRMRPPKCPDLGVPLVWNDPNEAAAKLADMIVTLDSKLFDIQFGPGSASTSRDIFTIFTWKCSSYMIRAICAMTLPGCNQGDCEPSTHMGCIRSILDELGACLGLSNPDLLEQIDRFTLDWLRGNKDRVRDLKGRAGMLDYTGKDAVCAMRWWFEGFQQALRSNTTAATIASVAAACDVTRVPQTQSKPNVRCVVGEKRSVEQLTSTSTRYSVFATTLGLTVFAANAAVAFGSSTNPVARRIAHQFATRRYGLRRGRLSAVFLGFLSTLVLFAGGFQAMLVPGGINPPGSTCGRDHGTVVIRDDDRRFSGWAVLYLTLALLSMCVTLNILLPPEDARTRRRRKSRRRRTGAMRLLCAIRAQYSALFGVNERKLGSLYLTKLVAFETFEIFYKLFILLTTLRNQESTVIVSMFALVGVNVVILPFAVLNVILAKKRSRALLTQLAINIVVDKSFTLMGVFLRTPTTDALSTFSQQFVYHGFILFSEGKSLRTLYKVVKLAKFSHTTRSRQAIFAASATTTRRRSHQQARGSTTSNRRKSQIGRLVAFQASLRELAIRQIPSRKKQVVAVAIVALLCVAGGAALITVPLLVVSRCDAMWSEKLGDLRHCASPVYYFGDDTCGLSRITSIDCQGGTAAGLPGRRTNVASGGNETAAAAGKQHFSSEQGGSLRVPEWPGGFVINRSLANLTCINVTNVRRLHHVPLYWRHLPHLHTLDISNTAVTQLPWQYCVTVGDTSLRNPNMTLRVQGAPAATFANWSHAQPSISDVSKDISALCLSSLGTSLEVLDLSHNQVNSSDALRALDVFTALQHLDLSVNGITEIVAWVDDSLEDEELKKRRAPFATTMRQPVKKQDKSRSCHVSFAGNEIARVRFSKAWLGSRDVTSNCKSTDLLLL